MTVVVFDLGTNIDREESLASALEHLSEHFTLGKASSVYSSTPVGMQSQPDFLNLALEVETDREVADIRKLLREIEDKMGRNRNVPKFGPRNIDIDVLLYGDQIDPEQKLPHPQTRTELFVVSPLAELYPEGSHPETGQAWRDLNVSLLGGRSAKDAGIVRHSSVSELPLGDKARSHFAQ